MSNSGAPMKRRNLFVMLILMFFLNIFYWLFWWCSVQNQIKRRTGKGFGGFGHFLLTIFTFGIYPIYWHFVVTGRIGAAGGPNRKVLYGLLYLVCILLSYGLMIAGFSMIISEVMSIIDGAASGYTPNFEYIMENLSGALAAAWAMSAIGSIFSIIQMYVIPLLIQNDINKAN